MRLLPKKYFKWREPKPFLRLRDAYERESRRWWERPLSMLIAFIGMMLVWLLARLNPAKHPPSLAVALLLALVLGIFFAYVIPWINAKNPSEITCFDDVLLRRRGEARSQKRIRFADLTSFEWRSASEFLTLVLHHRSGSQFFIGVPLEFSTDALSNFLTERIPQKLSGA